ncbi:MAG: MFS transporter [Acidobacteria bacterium]|nr:MFS transporter [Acidobacteriota bacterium]
MLRRWIPTVTMMLVSTISYIDRNTLALLIPTIRQETGISAEQYGFIVSAFSMAYMVGNPIWGALLDRLGLRVGMLLAVGLWTIASGAHAWATGFLSFAALRLVLGFGEGATFPGALRTVTQTLPPENRGRGVALSYSGGSLGAIITPLLMAPVAAALGWRGGFLFTGAVGVVWLVWWAFLSRRDDIRAVPTAAEDERARVRFRDRRLWAFLSSYALGSVPLGFVLYYAALYLASPRFGLTQRELGQVLWIPPLGWEVGYFFWGWVCDRLGGRSIRHILTVATVLSLPLIAAPYVRSLPLLMFQLFFAMFITSGFIIPSVHYATQIFSRSQTALIAGLGAGSFSAFIALLAPQFGRWFDQQNYEMAFLVAGLLPAMGFVLWMGLTGGGRSSASTSTNPAA